MSQSGLILTYFTSAVDIYDLLSYANVVSIVYKLANNVNSILGNKILFYSYSNFKNSINWTINIL